MASKPKTKRMVILVSGSRDWEHCEAIEDRINKRNSADDQIFLLHGGARGADTIAAEFGKKLGYIVQSYPAHWIGLKKRAGGIRNSLLAGIFAAFLDNGFEGFFEAFPLEQSVGTRNMILRMQQLARNKDFSICVNV